MDGGLIAPDRIRYAQVSWSALPRWNFGSAAATELERSQPQSELVRLGEVAEDAAEYVLPSSRPEFKWPVFGINNTDGVVFSHEQDGATFRTRYKRIYKDWFIHNPTRANVGSIGRVGNVPADALTSPEYQVWRLTAALRPDFMEAVLQTRYFQRQIALRRVGGVKQRLLVRDLLEIPIPLPDLPTQERIGLLWANALSVSQHLADTISHEDTSVQESFLEQLGHLRRNAVAPRRWFVSKLSTMDRWGVSQPSQSTARGSGRLLFPLTRLGEVIRDLENGWSPKCHPRPARLEEWGILKMGAVSFGQFDPSQNKALPESLRPRPNLEVRQGDLLIARANVTRLVGASVLVGDTRPRLLLCDKIFRVKWITPSPVYPPFLDEILKSHPVREQIESGATGTSSTMKNITKPRLMDLSFPFPPLAEQIRMTEEVSDRRSHIADLVRQRDIILSDARREIERVLFEA